jgi:signal transduction histidine kinase
MLPRIQRAWLPWLSVGLLALLCAILGFLQYRWTGDIAVAERSRLREELQGLLMPCGHTFNENISSALHGLVPSGDQVGQAGREAAWSAQYLRWKQTHGHLLQRAGLEIRDDSGTRFLSFDLQSGQLTPSARPEGHSPELLEVPQAGPGGDWLLAELDLNFLRTRLLPEMLNSCLATPGKLDYDVEVVSNAEPPALIYSTVPGATVWDAADAAIPVFDVRPEGPTGRSGRLEAGTRPALPRSARGIVPFGGHGHSGPPFGMPGRWRLLARHKSGSLETLVDQTQRRNLAVSAGVLLLILGTVVMLIRNSRQAQRLAELQMNFVAGVSHELRTPLTVIRTAAYNLRNPRFSRNEEQIERYGKMIEAESGKLERLVDQVMRFASARAGHAVRTREPVDIAELIEAELTAARAAIESRGVTLDRRIEPDLPAVMADGEALRHALRNLLDNALKYGAAGTRWIGVGASTVHTPEGDFAEISVADRGPGIPPEEQARIFDEFFRGGRAIRDQVHGTGLGLSLVKTIVEAHSGTVTVTSDGSSGTRFVIRIPAAGSGVPAGGRA